MRRRRRGEARRALDGQSKSHLTILFRMTMTLPAQESEGRMKTGIVNEPVGKRFVEASFGKSTRVGLLKSKQTVREHSLLFGQHK